MRTDVAAASALARVIIRNDDSNQQLCLARAHGALFPGKITVQL